MKAKDFKTGQKVYIYDPNEGGNHPVDKGTVERVGRKYVYVLDEDIWSIVPFYADTERYPDCLIDGGQEPMRLFPTMKDVENSIVKRNLILEIKYRVEHGGMEDYTLPQLHKMKNILDSPGGEFNVWYSEEWTRQDLVNALEYREIDATEENILKLRQACEGIFDDNSDRNEMIDHKVCQVFHI